jgi:hypothetical protein
MGHMLRMLRMLRAGAIALLLLGRAPLNSAPASPEGLKEHLFDISQNASLVLTAPANWRVAARLEPDNNAPVFVFAPPQGTSFAVMVTPLPDTVLEPGFNEPEKMRTLLEYNRSKLLSRPDGTILPIQEITVPDGAGYYFELQSSAPDPGGFRFLIQGIRGLPHMLLLFTVLTHTKEAVERQAALEMIQGARETLKRPD